MAKKKEFIKIESISRGQNLYTDWTIVRVENSTPLFIKDEDWSILKKLEIASPEQAESILNELGSKVNIGNPNTEKPKPEELVPAKKEDAKKKEK